MLDKIKAMFGVKKPTKKTKSSPKLSEKEIATRAGEPWVSILNVDIQEDDINNGAFEMDWNDKFVLNLKLVKEYVDVLCCWIYIET